MGDELETQIKPLRRSLRLAFCVNEMQLNFGGYVPLEVALEGQGYRDEGLVLG